MTANDEWRLNRERGWTKDIGYALQHVVRTHRYYEGRKGSKPNDPGWNECECGWAGYWCEFEPHVADELRAVVQAHQGTGLREI